MIVDSFPAILEPGQSDGAAAWLTRAQQAWSASTEWFDASVRFDLERDYKQFQGEHPPGSKYFDGAYKGRSKLFDPKTRTAIRRNEAIAAEAFFSTDDVVSIQPDDDSDPMQMAGAKMMQYIVQMYLSKKLPWFTLLAGSYQEAQKAGIVIGYVHWDGRKQKPLIKLVPPESFRIDPGAEWFDPIGTSPYVIQTETMRVQDVRQRMAEGLWMPAGDDQIKAAVVPFDTLRQTREGRRVDPQKQGIAITDYSLVWVHRYIMEGDDGQDVVFHTLGQNFLLEVPKPIAEVYAHGMRPYVMGCCAVEVFKNYPAGISRMNRDLQIALNTVINTRLDNVQFGISKRFFVKRGTQVDTLSLTRPGVAPVTMLNDPERDVKVVDIPDVTAGAYQEQDRIALAFDDLAGNFSNASVQSNKALNETVGGMQLLTSNSSQVGGYQLRTFVETFVEPVLRLLMATIAYYEKDAVVLDRAMRVADVEGVDPAEILLTMDGELRDLTLSVNVGMNATNPIEKVNRFMTALRSFKEALADGILDRYGMDVGEVIKELFGNLGYKDGARFFGKTEDPRIKALEGQVQQLQQALDAKYPPELLKAQVGKLLAETEFVKAGQVEKGVRASFEAIQAGGAIAANPQLAGPADIIMEGAGYQSPNPPGDNPGFSAPEQAMPLHLAGSTNEPAQPAQPVGAGVGAAAGIETVKND